MKTQLTKREQLIAMMMQGYIIKYGENDNYDWWIRQSKYITDLILKHAKEPEI